MSQDAINELEWGFFAFESRKASRAAIALSRKRLRVEEVLLEEFDGGETTEFDQDCYTQADVDLKLYGPNLCSKGQQCDAPDRMHRAKAGICTKKICPDGEFDKCTKYCPKNCPTGAAKKAEAFATAQEIAVNDQWHTNNDIIKAFNLTKEHADSSAVSDSSDTVPKEVLIAEFYNAEHFVES